MYWYDSKVASSFHREKCTKALLVVSCLFLARSPVLCPIGRVLLFLLYSAATTDSCLVFAMGLDCWYPDKNVHNSLFTLTFNLLYLWSVGLE